MNDLGEARKIVDMKISLDMTIVKDWKWYEMKWT